MSSTGADTLTHVFLDLKGRSKESRVRASYELLNHVNVAHRGGIDFLFTSPVLIELRSCVR